MGEKRFNGKAIYNPSGKAGEYSQWACNYFTGCSNECDTATVERESWVAYGVLSLS